VDVAVYRKWHDSAAWDAKGDPVSGNNTVVMPATSPAGTTTTDSATADPVNNSGSGSSSSNVISILINGESSPIPEPVLQERKYLVTIGGIKVLIILQADNRATLQIGNVVYTYIYTEEGCLITLRDEQTPLLELAKYKTGLMVVPVKKIVLEVTE